MQLSTLQNDVQTEQAQLSELARDVLRRCQARGASQAELTINRDRGLSVNVRMGEVETVERTRNGSLTITVFFGQCKAHASTGDLAPASIEATIDQACAIARYTEADPAAGLADAKLMATQFGDYDLWHPWAIDADQAIALAIQAETAGRDVDSRISNSDGASVGFSESVSVYANSHGFVGAEAGTHHSLSCSLIAGQGDRMQRDYWYTSAVCADDLEAATAVGRQAAQRALRRLDPRSAPTGSFPVVFVPEMARSLIGHLVSAVSGSALYRKASFLIDAQGKKLFPDWFSIDERPHLLRGFRSEAFDGDGVATIDSSLIDAGVLQRYVLSTYSARKLGLQTTGNAGGIHNLLVKANADDLNTITNGIARGLMVTELMGQGVNTVTGDYSRGAAGFWIENGQIAYPVDEITIAGNLNQMFSMIEAVGADVDVRSHIRIGSVLIGQMMVAGDSSAMQQ